MNTNRKFLSSSMLILVLALILSMSGCNTQEQSKPETSSNEVLYPEKDITLIIPTSAGGGYDLGARNIARFLPKHLPNNVNVIPTNMPGAGQMIGVHSLYAAKPDGYTIGAFDGTGALIAQFIRPDATKFDIEEFEYLGLWQVDGRIIGVSNEITAETWDELVARSKDKPIIVGTGGVGTSQHTDALLLEAVSDIDFEYVHYDGSANLETGIARKEVEIEIAQYSTIEKLEKQDTGRAFCILADARSENAPNVPTALEIGMPKEQYEKLRSLPFFGAYRGIAAPPGTDPEIVEILREALWNTFQDPEYIEGVKSIKGEHNPMKGKEYGLVIKEKIAEAKSNPDIIEILKDMEVK